MDALLRYLLYNITYTVLFVEVLLIILCVLIIVVTKILRQWISERREQAHNHLTLAIEESLFDSKSLPELAPPNSLFQFRNFIEVLEEFDQRFNDAHWIEVKNGIISTYLLKQAESYANSSYWYKRQLAARCYLLSPQYASEDILSKLLQDKNYLVRIPAAICITKTSYKKLFYEMIKQMSQEHHLSQFPYRDALIQIDQERYEWIEALLASDPNPAISAICLDILSTRYSHNLFSQVARFLNSPNRECRLKAVEALGNIPSQESIQLLVSHLHDTDFQIRESSIIGLEKLYAIKELPKIGELLNDPIWSVRLQAAKTLKALGKEGLEILGMQNRQKVPKAYEIAQYVLALPY